MVYRHVKSCKFLDCGAGALARESSIEANTSKHKVSITAELIRIPDY
jgi:hypothetical protein